MSETRAFRVAPERPCLACDRVRPIRNAPAPRVNCPFRFPPISSKPSPLPLPHRRAPPPSRASKASPAFWVLGLPRVPAPRGLRALCPLAVTSSPGDQRLPHSPGGALSRRETLVPLCSIAMLLHQPIRVPDAAREGQAAAATLPGILFPPAAFAAARNNSRPWLDARGEPPDLRPRADRWTASTADRWHGPGSRADRDHSDA